MELPPARRLGGVVRDSEGQSMAVTQEALKSPTRAHLPRGSALRGTAKRSSPGDTLDVGVFKLSLSLKAEGSLIRPQDTPPFRMEPGRTPTPSRLRTAPPEPAYRPRSKNYVNYKLCSLIVLTSQETCCKV